VLDDAAALADTTGEARLGASARLYRARALLRAGRAAEAASEALVVEEEARGLGAGTLEALALGVQAAAALAVDSPSDALALSTRAMARRDALGTVEEDEAELFLVHARALEAAGHPDEARATRERGRARLEQIAQSIGDPDLRGRFLTAVEAHRALAG